MPSIVEEIIQYGVQVDRIINQLVLERDQLKAKCTQLEGELAKLKSVRNPDNEKEKK